MTRPQHILTWYSKTTERRVGCVPVRGLSTEALRHLFHAAAGDPMFDSYAVGAVEATALKLHVNHKFRLSRYDYFVECEAVAAPHREFQAS